MDNPAQLREQVQKAIVDLITARLEAGTLNEDRAKDIAKYVLEALPEGISSKQLVEILPKMDDAFNELSPVIVPLMQEYEIKIKATMDEQIARLMKEGKSDEALQLAKQAIDYESKLA